MTSERLEWVEIIEPRTKEHMYANLTTGECVWDPPAGVAVKKTDNNQWWELFDQNTSRFYYYNATSQKTVWHRPQDCDIIPLAKLQTLKQNTEPVTHDDEATGATGGGEKQKKHKESVSTQTPDRAHSHAHREVPKSQPIRQSSRVEGTLNSPSQPQTPQGRDRDRERTCRSNTETQTSPCPSPRATRKNNHHHHHHHHHHHRRTSGPHYKTNHSQDSGRSSDSSSVSHSRTSLESGYRLLESPHHSTRTGQASPSGAGISLSTSTPIFRKKPLAEINQQSQQLSQHQKHSLDKYGLLSVPMAPPPLSSPSSRSASSSYSSSRYPSGTQSTAIACGPSPSLSKQRSLDVQRSNRRRVNTEQSPIQTSKQVTQPDPAQLSRSYSFIGQRPRERKYNNSYDEEDSMHEKYFIAGAGGQEPVRSVESTPQARRKTTSKSSNLESEGRSPHARSEDKHFLKKVDFSDRESWSSTEETTQSSPSSPLVSHTQTRKDKEKGYNNGNLLDNTTASGQSTGGVSGGTTTAECTVCQGPLFRQQSSPHQQHHTPQTHQSNLDLDLQYSLDTDLHLLPLHQYILEQAKLSGCYRFGDPLNEETDSLRSDEEDEEDGAGGARGESRGSRWGSSSAGGPRDEVDSDEFADDEEGMSNQDSSSQEYLDDGNYLQYANNIRIHTDYDEAVSYYNTNAELGLALRGTAESQSSAPHPTSTSGHHGTPSVRELSTTVSGLTSGESLLGPPGSGVHETQHASLKRKKDPPPPPPTHHQLYSPIAEKSEVFLASGRGSSPLGLLTCPHSDPGPRTCYRPSSLPPHAPHMAEDQVPRIQALNRDKKLPSESDIEKYAQDNLNIHKKGIFRKKFSVRELLSWSKDPIRKPMLVLSDKALKKEACELFKLVQVYMSDRKAKLGMTLNSVALDICILGYTKPQLRDELYIQICRQTTENPRRESLRRGWELLAICLCFFPPSPTLESYLDGYMNRHRDPSFDFPEVAKWPVHVQVSHYATVGRRRLERIGVGGKRAPKKPTLDEIEQARIQIFRPSMFGNTLEEVMALQKERFPNRRLPWVQTTLSEQVLRLQGASTEGIFRVSADVDEVTSLKQKLDRWECPTDLTDAHSPASLLKLWYRELYQPLIPDWLYTECVENHQDPERALAIVTKMPPLNRLVLCYLIRFLQIFAQTEVVQITKMDASNLAMVMAPNCLRCTSQDPRIIIDNARKEMGFIRTLIQCLDTSFMEGVY